VARAVCGKRYATWKAMICPPSTICSAGEEIGIELKPVNGTVMWVAKVQVIASNCVYPADSTSTVVPTSQREDLVAESPKVLVGGGVCDLWRCDDQHKAVRGALRIHKGALLPEPLFIVDLGGDLCIRPLRHCHFSQEAKVDPSLLRRRFTELARLPMLAPREQTVSHLVFSGSSVVEQRVCVQNVIAELLRHSASISTQAGKQLSRSAHWLVLGVA
jgi:hypothetical protein